MIYSLYKTVNQVNGKFYIGVHKEYDYPKLDDYLGSGVALKIAIKKHGRENFIREIIHIFDNPKDAFEFEELVVDKEFIKRRDNYNMSIGGCGVGFCEKSHSIKTKEKLKNIHINKPKTKEHREKISASLTGKQYPNRSGKNHHMFGKHHSDSTKNKMKLSHIGIKIKRSDGKKCIIDDIEYSSFGEASRSLNIKRNTLCYRIKSKSKKFNNYVEII